jgi:membrane-associated phospholipid phosphatase
MGRPARAHAALAAVLLAVGSWAALRPFDAAVAAWAAEGPATAAAWTAVDYALRVGLVGLVIAAAAATAAPARALGGALLLVVGGNLAAEVLKTVIERARPSDLAAVGGNSLPSGHVMGCTVTVLVAIGLLRQVGWPRRVRLALAMAALAAVAIEGVLRVARGSHWLSDVPASALLGAAWVLGASATASFAPRAVAAWLALLAATYALFLLQPGWRLQVP